MGVSLSNKMCMIVIIVKSKSPTLVRCASLESVVGTVTEKVCIFFETAKLLRINLCKTLVFERRLHIITVSFARLTINFVVSLLLNFSGSCFSSFRLRSFSNFLPFLLSIGSWFLFLFYVAVSFEFTSHLNSKLEYIF